jgi:hypothetical protein
MFSPFEQACAAAAPASAAVEFKQTGLPGFGNQLRKSTRMATARENIAKYLERHLN